MRKVVAREGEKLNLVMVEADKIKLWGYDLRAGEFFYYVRKLRTR
jgi:hypothetical protein